MKETMKTCMDCGNTGQIAYCPDCGELMRDILAEENGEIFVAPDKDSFIGVAGFHAGCRGTVKRHKSSKSGAHVFSCQKCYLRMRQWHVR